MGRDIWNKRRSYPAIWSELSIVTINQIMHVLYITKKIHAILLLLVGSRGKEKNVKERLSEI